nr:hypothetical protein [Tanacetum cinerariifolium]
MGDDVDINTLTIEQYPALIQDNIRSGIVKPEIDGDIKFEINGNFMRELRRKLFKGTDDEDTHEHVRRVLEIVDLFHFPDVTYDVVMFRVSCIEGCEGTGIATLAQSLKSIQVMADHSHNWDKRVTFTKFKKAVIGTPARTHKENTQMDNSCDITVKDVEKLRQMLTPTIHTLPNPEPVVQPCIPLSQFHDKAIVAKEKEQDNDIPLQDGVMQI